MHIIPQKGILSQTNYFDLSVKDTPILYRSLKVYSKQLSQKKFVVS
jgi:hypothetical protein